MKVFGYHYRSRGELAKDALALAAAVLVTIAVLGCGGYGIWLDIQAKRAVIELGRHAAGGAR